MLFNPSNASRTKTRLDISSLKQEQSRRYLSYLYIHSRKCIFSDALCEILFWKESHQ
jgi:hypothetical protein